MPAKKPLNTLKLTGTFRHNKGRYDSRTIPAAHDELGDPPLTLSIQAQACWYELALTAPPGLLGRSDRLAVEIASNLMSEFRADPIAFPAARMAVLQRILAKFAMLPGDRATMRLPEPPKKDGDDPFAEFTMEKLLDDTGKN